MRWLLFFISLPSLVARTITIDAGVLLDGKGGVLRSQQITVEGSKITRVAARQNAAATYDLRGYTVMPGWIDTHVHLDWHFGNDGKLANTRNEKPEEVVLYDAENAWLTLQGGFTTVQSVGSKADGSVRDRINQGSLPGPRILTSLRQINKDSGNPEALRKLVRDTKAEAQI